MIDIGGGSTGLVIGENFEPGLVESRRYGLHDFAQLYFPGGVINKRKPARPNGGGAKTEVTRRYRIQGWNA